MLLTIPSNHTFSDRIESHLLLTLSRISACFFRLALEVARAQVLTARPCTNLVAMAHRPSAAKAMAAGCCGALAWTIAPSSQSTGFAVTRGAQTGLDRAQVPATQSRQSRPAAQGGVAHSTGESRAREMC